MDRKFTLTILLGALVLVAFTVYAQFGSDSVIFLEHSLVANGTVKEGSVKYRTVDFPSYWFNENTRELHGEIGFPLNDSLMIIFGDSLTLKGNFGAGTGNKLYGIYQLPEKANEALIQNMDRAGNVAFTIKGKYVRLQPGHSYTYTESEKVKEGDAVIDIDYEHTYLNRGLIEKSCITPRMIAA